MGVLFSTAAIYFALGNYFIGAVQILVYAGAIAVLFVFIVMLLDLKPSLLRFYPGRKPYLVVAALVGLALTAVLFFSLAQITAGGGSSPDVNSAQNTAMYFVSKYQVAFQAAGFLVFAAIIGAISLAHRHLGKTYPRRTIL